MTMQQRPTVIDLDELGWRIECRGIGSLTASELAEVATQARDQDLSAVLTGVLIDPDAPLAARERAFGRLALQLTRHRGTHFVLVA